MAAGFCKNKVKSTFRNSGKGAISRTNRLNEIVAGKLEMYSNLTLYVSVRRLALFLQIY
jgi:hypothetical protein